MTTLSGDPTDYEFDIAVSFAGEERDFVEQVIRAVNADGDDDHSVRVFYDRENRYDSWGKDLIEYFSDVYMNRARYVVMFISSSYAQKEWTRLERRSSLVRALEQKSEYILPVRMDNTQLRELKGLLPSVAYLSADDEGSEGIAAAIRHKVGRAVATAPPAYRPRVAKTDREVQELIAVRPPAWEYLLWASALVMGRDALAEQRRDHDLGYGSFNGMRVTSSDELLSTMRGVLDDLNHAIDNLNKVLAPSAFRAAVGKPGEAGDPDRILHIGQRFMDIYGHMLRIAAELRGTSSAAAWTPVFETAAHLTDKPLEGIDSFLDELVPLMNALPAKLDAGENIEIQLTVTIHMDNDLAEQLVADVKNAIQRLPE